MWLFVWDSEPSKIFVGDTAISKVFLWDTQVRPSGWGWWQPWANTLLYLPLESNFVDQSWQATTRVFTTSSVSYTTVGGVSSVHIGSSWWAKLTTPYPLQPDNTKPISASIWLYITAAYAPRRMMWDIAARNWNRQQFCIIKNTTTARLNVYDDHTDSNYATLEAPLTINQRNHLAYTITSSESKLYLNWQLADSWAWNPKPWWLWPYSRDKSQSILCNRSSGYTDWLNWNAREIIMEEVVWSAQDVLNYYNQTKWDFWIS